MMTDRYTKIVLTVIAVALVTLAVEHVVKPAGAQFGDGCGSNVKPCYVRADGVVDVFVKNLSLR